ncbi:peroxidase [Sarracenia purpurea var. burkii]
MALVLGCLFFVGAKDEVCLALAIGGGGTAGVLLLPSTYLSTSKPTKMAMSLALCLLIMLKISTASAAAEMPNTLNKTCIDDGSGSFFLQFGVYPDSCPEAESIIFSWVEKAAGGPGWEVQTGRRDSLSASKSAANNNIPGPNSDVATLEAKFQNVGLTLADMVTLSGAHTIGKARCSTFNSRLNGNSNSNNSPDINLDFLQSLRQLCSEPNSNTTIAQLDLVTPSTFDNQYYVNLISGEGLLASDQVLITGDDRTRQIVQSYVDDSTIFFEEFKRSMLKMGNLGPLTGYEGQIRKNCRIVNNL